MRRAATVLLFLFTPSLFALTPEEVVGKWREAVRGRATKSMTVVTSTSDEDGIQGTIQEWLATNGTYRRLVTRPFDESEVAITASAAARRDWNGFIRKVEGEELKRLRTAAFEQEALFNGPKMTAVAEATVIDDRTIALNETPKGGTSITWFIDRSSWLPQRAERAGVDSTITSTFSEWSTSGRLRAPRTIVVTETDKPDYHVRVASIRHESAIAKFNLPLPGPSDVRMDALAPPIPFNFENGHIMFKAAVNGRPPMWFIFDTGADQEVINAARANDFGITPYGKSATTGGGNTAEYDFARDVTISLPGVELVKQHVALIDETGLERALGMPIAGLLGYDFISRFVVEIDYAKQLLMLHDPRAWKYDGSGYVVPITFDEGIPFMHGTISVPTKPDIPAYFVLDFGAQETMTLTSPFVKQHDLARLAQTGAAVNRPAGLEKEFFAQNNVRGRVAKLDLGKLHETSIPVNMSVNAHGAYASASFSGTVGQGIYRRYYVFIDYPRNRVIFEPTQETSKPFPERQTYGVSFLASGPDLHTYTVAAVRAGSPAEVAGFKKGDVVTALDGSTPDTFTLGELREKLSRAGEHHEIRVTRAGGSVVIPVDVQLISLDRG